MKLENVDVAKLQLDNIPKFSKCPCELCDDGCFDRAGYKHHPECRRKISQRTKLPLTTRCPLTHYQATFFAATDSSGQSENHRRYPFPPPRDNEIPISFRNVPMSGLSAQRDDYQTPPANAIQKGSNPPVKRVDNLVVLQAVPMETKTHYQVEYVEKPVIPVALRALKDPTQDSSIHITDPTATLASQTTNRSHFKSWRSAPSHPYTEIPAIAGHVLFPSSDRQFSTSSGSTFIPFKNASKAKPIVRLEESGNLRLSGSMDLRTNYRQDYISREPVSAHSIPSEQKGKINEENVYTRRPMNEISQTTLDYRSYPKHRPPPPAEMETFLSQFQIGSSLTPATKRSQYQIDYEGIDTSRYPRPPLAGPKDHQRTYEAPIQKMDTLTVTQRDFQPLDMSTIPRARLVPMQTTLSVADVQMPMESVSMSRHQFQAYDGVKAKRYGDPMPSFYIPSFEKFESRTTNGETYQGRPGLRARAHVAEVNMIHTGGQHDHNTNYRVDYHPHGLSICAAKAYAIAQQQQKTATPIATQ